MLSSEFSACELMDICEFYCAANRLGGLDVSHRLNTLEENQIIQSQVVEDQRREFSTFLAGFRKLRSGFEEFRRDFSEFRSETETLCSVTFRREQLY
jgi:hypothetical protein